MLLDKFIPPFIDFIDHHFDSTKHTFILLGKPRYEYGLTKKHNVKWIDKTKVLLFLRELYRADKIIIHGLWSELTILLLFLQPWLLKKCYWVMWGGDFYFPKEHSWIKKQVMKKMGHYVTSVRGDYELGQQWYGAKGEYHHCLVYPSNLYKNYVVQGKKETTITIQIGNSADPTNNHREIFKKLEKYKGENIKIFAPLSYGDQTYARMIADKGHQLFGDKFFPIVGFMPFEQYLEFLNGIDIAIFAHNRQQAMGNTITLLGLGKKVYMKKEVTSCKTFNDLEIQTFDIETITMDPILDAVKEKNRAQIKKYFSEEALIEQLRNIF